MLHEILLSLSGHPSPLFSNQGQSRQIAIDAFPLLSPPETELLSCIGRLSYLHAQTRTHASTIASSHPSAVCRAVGTAIISHHLENFQRKIQDVERQILVRDSAVVGAYNMVPLATIVAEFSSWTKLMEWLWYIACFMLPVRQNPKQGSSENGDRSRASGAEIIDKLRSEGRTGYPDIEEAAKYLSRIAEASWLRQLSGLVLYGRLPLLGAQDFFIHPVSDDGADSFTIEHKLLPNFVTRQAASSILFIGNSLNQIRVSGSRAMTDTSEQELLASHIRKLSGVQTPISSANLSAAIADIRLSLSKNMLQYLLPIEKIVETLMILREFFLLGRGEFAVVLIAEADKHMQSRHQQYGKSQKSQAIRGILLKEGEISNVLLRSWSALSSLNQDDTRTDDLVDTASKIIHLGPCAPTSNRPGTPGRAKELTASLPNISGIAMNDFLFPVPTSLTMDIRSPLDLFLTNNDLDFYSAINSYLLTLRRTHLHLTHLWRQTPLRREYPAPMQSLSRTAHGRALLATRRHRSNIRTREMRKVWATCSAAVFLLSESEAYFQGEVIEESWKSFRAWVTDLETRGSDSGAASSSTSNPTFQHIGDATAGSPKHADPETIAVAHRNFLAALAYSLLLTDSVYTKCIREFFRHVDDLVALINRLQTIQQNLDLEEDEGVEDSLANYRQEEREVVQELDRARKRLDSDMKSVISRLRDIDAERVGQGPMLPPRSVEAVSFEPLRVGGVDRLLMKLDWGDTVEDDEEELVPVHF